jgi:hypothetical protein
MDMGKFLFFVEEQDFIWIRLLFILIYQLWNQIGNIVRKWSKFVKKDEMNISGINYILSIQYMQQQFTLIVTMQ